MKRRTFHADPSTDLQPRRLARLPAGRSTHSGSVRLSPHTLRFPQILICSIYTTEPKPYCHWKINAGSFPHYRTVQPVSTANFLQFRGLPDKGDEGCRPLGLQGILWPEGRRQDADCGSKACGGIIDPAGGRGREGGCPEWTFEDRPHPRQQPRSAPRPRTPAGCVGPSATRNPTAAWPL
jgi:hypothetical protein